NQPVRLLDARANHPLWTIRDHRVRHSGNEAVVVRLLVLHLDRRVPLLLFDQHFGQGLLVIALLQRSHQLRPHSLPAGASQTLESLPRWLAMANRERRLRPFATAPQNIALNRRVRDRAATVKLLAEREALFVRARVDDGIPPSGLPAQQP